MQTSDAYRHCERLTRERAGNFFYGIRLLPQRKRMAMCAVYAFARLADDVGDGDLPAERKRSELDALSAAVRRLSQGLDPQLPSSNGGAGITVDEGPVPRLELVVSALEDAHAHFGLPLDALDDLIAGVRADIDPRPVETFDALVAYCRLVAGSIGRLCVAIFGASDPVAAQPLADDLGVAMQITNVLRDVREDHERNRIYLPAEDMARYGVAFDDLGRAADANVCALVGFEAARAREWFERGLQLVPLLDRRSAACVLAMTGIYRRLLDRIEATPAVVTERRLSLPAWEKAWVATRSLVGAAA